MGPFDSYEAIPVWLADYLLTVSDAERITDLTIEDINDFLRGLDDYYSNRTINPQHSDVAQVHATGTRNRRRDEVL